MKKDKVILTEEMYMWITELCVVEGYCLGKGMESLHIQDIIKFLRYHK